MEVLKLSNNALGVCTSIVLNIYNMFSTNISGVIGGCPVNSIRVHVSQRWQQRGKLPSLSYSYIHAA